MKGYFQASQSVAIVYDAMTAALSHTANPIISLAA
jgi:hypothetical protein